MMRRRLWCEFLDPAELGAPATVRLLQRYGIEPIIAMPPGAEATLAPALSALGRGGVKFGLWPLLSDDEGYWPSDPTATAFVQRVDDMLRFVAQAGLTLTTLAVDLEPPLGETRELLGGPWARRAAVFWAHNRALAGKQRSQQRTSSTQQLSALRRRLSNLGVETIAAAVPHTALDFSANTTYWQALLQTPVTGPGWSVISLMLYTSILEKQYPWPNRDLAEALLFVGAQALAAAATGARASLSIGLVSNGKMGIEPIYEGPAQLKVDVQLARAAGIDDLALFSLEGILRRGDPEQWLTPFVRAMPKLPSGLRSQLLHGSIWAMVRTSAALVRLSGSANIR